MLARILAVVAHEIITEYRKLEPGPEPECQRQHADDRRYDVALTTAAQVERAPGWDHDQGEPITAAKLPVGFAPPARISGGRLLAEDHFPHRTLKGRRPAVVRLPERPDQDVPLREAGRARPAAGDAAEAPVAVLPLLAGRYGHRRSPACHRHAPQPR